MQINVIKYVIFCKHTHTHMYIDDKCIKSTFFVKDIKLLSSYSGWRYHIKSYIIRSWNARNGVHLTEDTCVTWFRWPFTVIPTLCKQVNVWFIQQAKQTVDGASAVTPSSHTPPLCKLKHAQRDSSHHQQEKQNQTLPNLRNIQHPHHCQLCSGNTLTLRSN